jgi:3,4-dihydroxy 2-butanone 4-phosphate synthase/GTP cyclohydrolase II
MKDVGTMARLPDLVDYCRQHELKLISVADLIRYRMEHERIVRRAAEGLLLSDIGEFKTVTFESSVAEGAFESHLALVHGDLSKAGDVLVRMHTRCTYGDVFGSTECDCRDVLRNAMKRGLRGRRRHRLPSSDGPGIRQVTGVNPAPCRGWFHTPGKPHHASPAGRHQLQHESGIGAQILSALGLKRIRL